MVLCNPEKHVIFYLAPPSNFYWLERLYEKKLFGMVPDGSTFLDLNRFHIFFLSLTQGDTYCAFVLESQVRFHFPRW